MRGFFALLCAAALLSISAPATSAAVPTNDNRADAIVISTFPFTDTVDTTEATSEPDDLLKPGPYPEDPTTVLDATVWYSYTADQDGDLNIEISPPEADVVALVQSDAMSFINVTSSSLPQQVIAGHTYLIMLGDSDTSNGSGGVWTFKAELYVEPPPAPVVYLAITSLRLDGGDLYVGGTLTILGGYHHTSGMVSAVQQGKLPATGSVVVGTLEEIWEVQVPATFNNPMKDARTTITVELWVWDADDMVLQSVTITETLKVARVPKKARRT